MGAIRYVYLLALVVWLGGMLVLGALVAPSTFQVLQARDAATGRVLAGAVFGEILRRFHVLSYAAGGVLLISLGVMAAVGPRPPAWGIRAGIVSIMLALSLYSGIPLTRQIERVQQEISGPVSALPESDPRRARFDRLHRMSTTLMMVNMVGGLILLYWHTRE